MSETPKTPSSVRSVRSTSSSQSALSILSGDKKEKSKLKIVSEETFLDEMGKIIERDFFPDIMDVRTQLGGTPTSAAPAGSIRSVLPTTFRCPSRYSASSRSISLRRRTAKAAEVLEPKVNPNLTLNQFLNSYTSEENHNLYTKMKEDSEKHHRIKYKWLYERKNSMINAAFSTPPINALMFHPPGMKPPKPSLLGICHRNTRSLKRPSAESPAGASKSGHSTETLPLMPVATPTPRPGEDGTPLITWGEIKSTPMLLQPPSTPKPPELSTIPATPEPSSTPSTPRNVTS